MISAEGIIGIAVVGVSLVLSVRLISLLIFEPGHYSSITVTFRFIHSKMWSFFFSSFIIIFLN